VLRVEDGAVRVEKRAAANPPVLVSEPALAEAA
jgi:hypothetical protein